MLSCSCECSSLKHDDKNKTTFKDPLVFYDQIPIFNINELLKVKYRVADLPALRDSVKSSFLISNTEASTYQGFPVVITPSRDELTVIARNRVGFYGDVNGDGEVDIADANYLAKHILGVVGYEDADEAAADVDGSGNVDMADVMYLTKHVIGLEEFAELK